MAQASKPEEKKEVRPGLTDNYTPAANVLIQGFPELSISERYVVIGLVSLYWDEKVYPVSLRELAAKIQIDHTTLRSRGGKRPAEGILDKLWRLGFIGLMEGKPLTDIGNKGRVQTYLSVNHRFIADQNQMRTQDKKTKSPRYTTVGSTNSETDKPTVGNTNDTVGISNDMVGDTNDTVGNTNHTVVHVSTKTPPKNNKNITNNSLRTERENDGEVASTSNDGFANATPALTLSEKEIAFILQSRMEKSNEPQANFAYSQDKPATDLQEKGTETVSSVESSGYRQESKPVDPPSKPTKSTSKAKIEQQGLPLQVDLGPLVMPDLNAAWPNAETAVTVSEVLRERRYTPKSRADQLTASRKMFKEFPAITRAQFETAFKQRNDAWWREHVGLLSLADLMAKDSSKAIRLSKILERLDTKPVTTSQPANQHVRASSPNTAGFQPLTEEERKRNIEKAKAMVAAKKAAQAATSQVTAAAI